MQTLAKNQTAATTKLEVFKFHTATQTTTVLAWEKFQMLLDKGLVECQVEHIGDELNATSLSHLAACVIANICKFQGVIKCDKMITLIGKIILPLFHTFGGKHGREQVNAAELNKQKWSIHIAF